MSPNFKTEIFISKPGLVCAAGKNSDELWLSALNGNQKGIVKTHSISEKEFYVAKVSDSVLQKSDARYDTRLIRLANIATGQIEEEITSVIARYGKERVAVCCGSCDNGTELSTNAHKEFVESGHFPSTYKLEMQGADYPASFIAEKYEILGPSLAFSTACSSSTLAIIKAYELIQAGLADAVIAGGVDVVSDTVLLGFDSLEAVSPEITNPFSKNRKGITLGEGAAFFVLAKDSFKNSPSIRLLGFGESTDAYHMTSPEPSGQGAEQAMRNALMHAKLKPSDIDYINLHGTGTKFNDSMEAQAVWRIFSNTVPCSTTKPLTGHTLGAAGALELAVCYNALSKNIGKSTSEIRLPTQVWDRQKDSELPAINIVDNVSEDTNNKNKVVEKNKIRTCLSNSFAFGGSNASIIIGL
ncbi:MAG: beta-ketoacyl-ACP synthase [Treponema sp.]|nr:beta-ketoacyl-ACP synthase [Treponema sp.]